MKKSIGLLFLSIAFLSILSKHYFVLDLTIINILSFSSTILIVLGIILVIPFKLIPQFIFDNYEWIPNKKIDELIKKMRLRAILFNNISVIVLFVTILMIIGNLYFLISPSILVNDSANSVNITTRISASILFIFLVQILFRVFKYLLRVAALYNGKADALEYNIMKPDMPLEKLIDIFTPEKYDISDLKNSSISDNLISFIKTKADK